MCTRSEAILRLIAAWLDRCSDDPDFYLRVTLADMVTDDNIDIVATMDLLAEHSEEVLQKKLATIGAETERNQALVRAWLAPRPKGAMTQ
jgi:hypothetical protein